MADGRPRNERSGRQRSPERSRDRRRHATPPAPAAASPDVAISRSNLRLLFTSATDLALLVEVERLLQAHNRKHPHDPPLSVVKGLVVRYNYRGYHTGIVVRSTTEEVQDGHGVLQPMDKVVVQVGHTDDEVPFRSIQLMSISTRNPTSDEEWPARGEAEADQLAQYLHTHKKALTLEQAADAVFRRRAALRWYERYRRDTNLAPHLPRLLGDLQDKEGVQKVAAEFELEQREQQRSPQSDPPRAQREQPRARRGSRSPPREQRTRRQSRSPPREQRTRRQSRSPPREQRTRRQSRSPPREQRIRQQSRSPLREQRTRRQSRSPPREQAQRRGSPRAQQQEQQRRASSPHQWQRAEESSRQQDKLPAPAKRSRDGFPQQQQQQAQPQRGSVQGRGHATSQPSSHQNSPADSQQQEQQRGGQAAAGRPSSSCQPAEQRHKQPPSGAAALVPDCFQLGATAGAVSSGAKPADTELEAARQAARAARPGSGASGSSASGAGQAAGAKRKRAPISWEPQPAQPGDTPLQPLDAAAAKAAATEPKAKQQKIARGAPAHGAAVAAADHKAGKQATAQPKAAAAAPKKSFTVTVRNTPPRGGTPGLEEEELALPPAFAVPKGTGRSRLARSPLSAAAELPPGFDGGSSGPSRPRSATFRREADYAGDDGSGGGRLTVKVRLPPSDYEDYAGGGSGAGAGAGGGAPSASTSTLAGRFDRLAALQQQLLDSPAPATAAVPGMPPGLQQMYPAVAGALGAGYPPGALQLPPGGAVSPAAHGVLHGGQAVAMQLQPPLVAQHSITAQQLFDQQQQQQQQQQQMVAFSPAEAAAGGYGSSGMAMPHGDADMADAAYMPEGEGRMVSRVGSGGGGGSGGSRRVELERSGSGAGGSSRGREGSAADSIFCPTTQWETDVLQLLQARPSGLHLGKLHQMLPLPAPWNQSLDAYSKYLLRRKQFFQVHNTQQGIEQSVVQPAKGASGFLAFKRSLLQYLADHKARVGLYKLQHGVAVPSSMLRQYKEEARADFGTFLMKYFFDEVDVLLPREPSSMVELRPFRGSQAGFKGPCGFWNGSRGSCSKGSACNFAHAAARRFAEPQQLKRRG